MSKILARAAKNQADKQTWELRYQFEKGQCIRWQTEHTTSNETRNAGKSEKTWTRSNSNKHWDVKSVDSKGNVSLDLTYDQFTMWTKFNDEQPKTIDSQTPIDQQPAANKDLLRNIGNRFATYTVNNRGAVDKHDAGRNAFNLGIADFLIPLPEQAIPVGHKWYVSRNYPVEDESGRPIQIPIRTVYELEKVVDQKAYISIRAQILAPIESEKVKMELMQQNSSGYAVFDIPRGQVIQRQYEWNDKVQGYPTPDSYVQYSAKIVEKLETANALVPLEMKTKTR
ncbi:MAG: hypothetical protein R3C03_00530 [Pirellulaceae bacterium]